jgi:hypothetical protein
VKIRSAGVNETNCRDGERREAEKSYIIKWESEKAENNKINKILINTKRRNEHTD